MYHDAFCPYCDEGVEIDHDDGYGYEEGETYEQECGNCGKTFVYTTSISYCYDLEQAPCKNGGEHELVKINGYPEAYYIGEHRCKFCDEKINLDPKGREEAMKEYREELSRKRKEEWNK